MTKEDKLFILDWMKDAAYAIVNENSAAEKYIAGQLLYELNECLNEIEEN